MSDQPFPERTNDRLVFWCLVLGLVVLFGGVYVAGYLFTSDKLPRNTSVAGVAIGGMTPQAADLQLARDMQGRAAKPIVVSAVGRRAAIDPGKAGLTLDVRASVAQVGVGRSWRPDRMWNFFSGGDEYDAVVHVDEPMLDRAIASFAATVDRPARNGTVTFHDGEASTTDPTTGSALDRTAAAAAVRNAYLTAVGPVPLRVTQVPPEISEADVTRAMNDFANPAMAASVTLKLGSREVVLQPDDYSSALSLEPQGGSLVPKLDDEVLMATLRPAMKRASTVPVDASVRTVKGKPEVVPGHRGTSYDPADITGKFLALVAGSDRNQKVRSVVTKPGFTTADARRLAATNPATTEPGGTDVPTAAP